MLGILLRIIGKFGVGICFGNCRYICEFRVEGVRRNMMRDKVRKVEEFYYEMICVL